MASDWRYDNDKAQYLPVNRHNGGSNYTFCDGHAKFYKKGQGPCALATGSDKSGWGDPIWDPRY